MSRDAGRLRVATLNIWHSREDWPARRAVLVAALTALDVDLVALQEVEAFSEPVDRPIDRPIGLVQDQSREIAQACGLDVVLGISFARLQSERLRHFGNAVLARHPVDLVDVHALPDAPDDEPRSLLHARVATPSGPLDVATTHLAWRPEAGAGRQAQVRRILEVLGENEATSSGPVLLLGDLNAEPGTAEVALLTGAGFVDAWAAVGEGPGWTYDPVNPYVAREEEPEQRIDYVFHRPGRPGTRLLEPVSARLGFTEPVGGEFASDHFGVVVDYRWGETS